MQVRMMVLACCLAGSLFGADSPFTGTWKLNLEKSKFTPGPGPQSLTMVIKADENSQDVKSERKAADGTATETSFAVKLDGTPAPITGSRMADTISVRKTNDHTIASKSMMGGKTVVQNRVTVSADGKILTVTGSGVNAQGVKTKTTAVYDKQ
jgi:hypothetical protein